MENKEIKQNKYGIEYTKQGDYYMPNLVLEKEKITLSKYGRARLNYLKTNNKAECKQRICTHATNTNIEWDRSQTLIKN